MLDHTSARTRKEVSSGGNMCACMRTQARARAHMSLTMIQSIELEYRSYHVKFI